MLQEQSAGDAAALDRPIAVHELTYLPDGDEVTVGRAAVESYAILPADGATVTERRRMSFGGLITVAVPVGPDGRLAGTPLIRPFGVPVEEDRDDFIADATDAATRPTTH